MEGYQNDTDFRRGAGVYGRVLESISRLKEKSIFWGTSLTMTRLNFDEVQSKKEPKIGCSPGNRGPK
jgi:MoaA/NifB/PqqE/SkfB family radical SAM enzyme